jgi:hypothetical protein
MKTFILALLCFTSISVSAQDLIVSSDLDTIPCSIDYVAQGQIAFVQQGASAQIKVLLTQVKAYKWRGKWTEPGGNAPIDKLPPIPSQPEIALRTGAEGLSQGGGMLVGGGIAILFGGGALIAREVMQDDLNATAYKALGYSGYGLMLLGGGLVVSAGFQISKTGIEMKQMKINGVGLIK